MPKGSFAIRNWKKFQHYKDRNPPWIKLHVEILSSADWVTLDDASKLLAVVCMVIAAKNDGRVPNDPDYIKRVAYLHKRPDLTPLIKSGFLSNPLADDSDSKQLQATVRPEAEAYRTEGERESKSPPPKKAAPKKLRSTLPEVWTCPEDWLVAGREKFPHLDIEREAEKFHTHHYGKQTKHLDWKRAFLVTWLLFADEHQPRTPAFLDRSKPGPGKIAIHDSSPEAAAAAKKAREWSERKAHLVRVSRYGPDKKSAVGELKSMGFDSEGKPLRKEVA